MTPEEVETAQLAATDMLAALLMVQAVADGYEAGKRGTEHPHSYTEWKAAVDAAIEKATGGKRPKAELTGAAPMQADVQTQPGVRSNDR